MNNDVPVTDKDSPLLNIVEGPENVPSVEVQVDLEEQRKQIQEQKEAEEFWAGRNLAGRKSTRKAA